MSDMAAMLTSSWDRWLISSASISGSAIVDSMMGRIEAFAALTACIERRVAPSQRDRYNKQSHNQRRVCSPLFDMMHMLEFSPGQDPFSSDSISGSSIVDSAIRRIAGSTT